MAVVDDRARRVTALDADARRSLRLEPGRRAPRWLPTLSALQRRAAGVDEDGGGRARVRYAVSDGRPVRVVIDPDGAAVGRRVLLRDLRLPHGWR